MKTQMEDYYKILGVARSAKPEEIKKAYRKLAQKHHPDLAEDKEKAKAEFQKLQQAYDVLKDPEKRRMYDQFGPDFERMGGAGGHPFGGGQGAQDIDFGQFFGGGAGGGGGQGGGGFSFEDIFRQFGQGGGGPGGRTRGGRQAPAKGADARASVTIPFNVAIQGGETSVSLRREGQSQTIKVKIPPGIESGKKIRLRGQGEPSPRGGQAGDLILEVNVAEHPFYKRQGDNLTLVLPISLHEAAHGAKIDVPTPKGTVTVTVPPGTSGGKKLRLRGMGVESKGSPGDLVIELSVRLPKEFSQEDLEIIDKLSSVWRTMPERDELRW